MLSVKFQPLSRPLLIEITLIKNQVTVYESLQNLTGKFIVFQRAPAAFVEDVVFIHGPLLIGI